MPTTLDSVTSSAVDLAREAAVGTAGDASLVGEHVGVEREDDRTVTHLFASEQMGYRGWRWAVTVSRAPRSRAATVDEVVLLPGAESLLAPAWVPWSERVAPGDLGVGDLLPTAPDDERLEPGYRATGREDPADDDADAVAVWELGLGRARVLSVAGKDRAAERWYAGARGPLAPIAAAAPAPCSTCGFLWPLLGSMRTAFGVCTNEIAPDDGQVVSMDHGCGAHSEAFVTPLTTGGLVDPIVDEVGYDVVALLPPTVGEHPPGSVEDDAPAEDLGHS